MKRISITCFFQKMCLSPINIEYVDFFGDKQCRPVGCGKCYECLLQMQNMWKIRMIEESKCWKYCYFFTLTYSDDKLPINLVADYPCGRKIVGELRGKFKNDLLLDSCEEVLSTACKKDIQNWLKRFRTSYIRRRAKHLGCYVRDITSDKELYNRLKPRFSYFVTAEYAPDGEYVDRHGKLRRSSCRPHYHGLIFSDLPRREFAALFADWSKNYGFVKWSSVRPRNGAANVVSAPANYVAKYCAKGEFASRDKDVADEVIEKPWRLMSKGLGASYVEDKRNYHIPPRLKRQKFEDYVDILLDRKYYYDGQFKYKLPRYYIERLYYTRKMFFNEQYNPKTKAFQPVVTYRYVSANNVSLGMQAALQRRIDAADKQRFEVAKSSHPLWSDDQIFAYLDMCERISLEARRKVARDKLNRFYHDNARKNSSLMH